MGKNTFQMSTSAVFQAAAVLCSGIASGAAKSAAA